MSYCAPAYQQGQCCLAGVGKTAVAEGLAQRIVKGDVPAALQVSKLSLEIPSSVAEALAQR